MVVERCAMEGASLPCIRESKGAGMRPEASGDTNLTPAIGHTNNVTALTTRKGQPSLSVSPLN